jgi:tetratricopeptide (TPR) repeat protein
MHVRYALHPVAGGGRAAWEDADDLLADKANAAGVQSVLKQMDLRAVPEGGYELRVDLRDGPVEGAAPGAVLATARTKVRVTAAAVSPARIVARSFETEDPAKAAHSAGLQLLAQGKFQAAREEFRVALGHDPDMAAAKINLARAMVLSGDALAAKEAILEITAAAPTPEALMVLGSAHAGLAEHADAVRAYERALELGGESPDVLNALAEALAQAGEKVRAREIARRSLALKADQPLLQRFLDSLGP